MKQRLNETSYETNKTSSGVLFKLPFLKIDEKLGEFKCIKNNLPNKPGNPKSVER